MGTRDPRIDAYIGKAAPFARPILERLRAWMHASCPECVETIKWSMPHFEYHGRLLAGMAAFKAHCTFGFWHVGKTGAKAGEAMGQFGRMASLADLPSKAGFAKLARRAMKAVDEGEAAAPKPRAPRKELVVPPALAAALRRNKAARDNFEAFTYSNRKEYVEWIEEAKTEETRERRLATSLEWIAENKPRHWKYRKK